MNKTTIEWTDFTWNPIHARRKNGGKTGNFCTRISPGCLHCYASKINQRWGNGLEYIVPNLPNVEFYLDEKELQAPLKLQTPSRIFVGDMFDLFHEAIPEEFIGHVWAMMAQCPWHTFQVLTKRTAEMRELLTNAPELYGPFDTWPLLNVHVGASIEDQPRADERIPDLLQTPAAVRWLSVEPMLEAIDLIGKDAQDSALHPFDNDNKIDWVVCGGESGPGARPFNLAWAESLLNQCRDADVPFFMKQVGGFPIINEARWREKHNPLDDSNGNRQRVIRDGMTGESFWLSAKTALTAPAGTVGIALKDAKGGDIAEWPENLRVREFPAERTVTA